MGNICLGIQDNDLFIVVEGRGTAEYCSELDAKIKNMLKSNPHIQQVLFEMSNAQYVDSSFIGLILSTKKQVCSNKENSVILLNPSNSIVDIFQTMGLCEFMPIVYNKDINCTCALLEVDQKLENSIADIKLLLKSHQEIMSTSEENRQRFALVEKVFQQEIQKKSQESSKTKA